MTNSSDFITIDGKQVPIEGERNILEIARKANIDIPTFCYHSELSVYGACRLCLIDVEGRGLVASCSMTPEPGMVVRTSTQEIRRMRKITVELLLASHEHNCTTCAKSGGCELQSLAQRFGVDKVRFDRARDDLPIDESSPCLVRDPNKCVLCGDCVRVCSEVQGIGAIDFVSRGSDVSVVPAFGKDLSQVECVFCGQCARVCPTGAITPKSETDDVWEALEDPTKTVIAQIAPAVRVGLGEAFGMEPGSVTTGQAVAALKRMGFDQIFDTSFAADLTVVEEATEFITRKTNGEKLPQFTSCCPGWVKFAEQYLHDLLPNLSSCRSPQQMFGSLAREMLPEALGVEPENLVVVSIMPCTAKKYEARRPEFEHDGTKDVDNVLTTQELAKMVKEAGLRFNELEPESLDMPFGFKTGAGVIFGSSGGVTEAVLRYAVEKLGSEKLQNVDFQDTRGEDGVREVSLSVAGLDLKFAIVYGLGNARKVAEKVRAGECYYDLVEVMACPGGCIGGAGQPVPRDRAALRSRAKGLYETDKMLHLHKSQDNPFVAEVYEQCLGEANGHKAHELLHTDYHPRRRITDESLPMFEGNDDAKLKVSVCVGTSCYMKGSQDLLHALIHYIEKEDLEEKVDVTATFCMERCGKGPNVAIGDEIIERCTLEMACDALDRQLGRVRA